jgi:hypothetical protein
MTYDFVESLGQVGDVQVRGLIITLGLEARVERLLPEISNCNERVHFLQEDNFLRITHTSKANLIAEAMKSTNAHLRVAGIKELGEAEA